MYNLYIYDFYIIFIKHFFHINMCINIFTYKGQAPEAQSGQGWDKRRRRRLRGSARRRPSPGQVAARRRPARTPGRQTPRRFRRSRRHPLHEGQEGASSQHPAPIGEGVQGACGCGEGAPQAQARSDWQQQRCSGLVARGPFFYYTPSFVFSSLFPCYLYLP
jgi:hypothetical protein